MIFQHTHNLVLSGVKTSTLRLADQGDTLCSEPIAIKPNVVMSCGGHLRWRVGSIYAVQSKRTGKSLGWIECKELNYVNDVVIRAARDIKFIRSEGFQSTGAFLEVWYRLHPSRPHHPCWRVEFELIQVGGRKPKLVQMSTPTHGDGVVKSLFESNGIQS